MTFCGRSRKIYDTEDVLLDDYIRRQGNSRSSETFNRVTMGWCSSFRRIADLPLSWIARRAVSVTVTRSSFMRDLRTTLRSISSFDDGESTGVSIMIANVDFDLIDGQRSACVK